jgi:hypothetical protein
MIAILATTILAIISVLPSEGVFPEAAQGIKGVATWYDDGPGIYAAAGPVLRDAIGPDWRGTRVTVIAGGNRVTVTLSDWCACGPRRGQPTLIDLSADAFRALGAPLSVGVLPVEVTVGVDSGGVGPRPTPPATDS